MANMVSLREETEENRLLNSDDLLRREVKMSFGSIRKKETEGISEGVKKEEESGCGASGEGGVAAPVTFKKRNVKVKGNRTAASRQ